MRLCANIKGLIVNRASPKRNGCGFEHSLAGSLQRSPGLTRVFSWPISVAAFLRFLTIRLATGAVGRRPAALRVEGPGPSLCLPPPFPDSLLQPALSKQTLFLLFLRPRL